MKHTLRKAMAAGMPVVAVLVALTSCSPSGLMNAQIKAAFDG